MPELIEIEYYRRSAEAIVGRRVTGVHAPDPWYLKGGLSASVLGRILHRRSVEAVRRHGKLLLIDTDGPTLGLRFGMTGRLLVDGTAAIERLEYASPREERRWDRLVVRFDGGGELRVRDPRRLGGIEIDPDEERLGPDAATVGLAAFRQALGASSAPLKARLLDQSRLAGVGNLICDETLWRASLDPARSASSLSEAEVRRLHRHLRKTIADLGERGGSHTGDLHHARVRGGSCPRDGAPLVRRTVGGRTTYSCPRHQR